MAFLFCLFHSDRTPNLAPLSSQELESAQGAFSALPSGPNSVEARGRALAPLISGARRSAIFHVSFELFAIQAISQSSTLARGTYCWPLERSINSFFWLCFLLQRTPVFGLA